MKQRHISPSGYYVKAFEKISNGGFSFRIRRARLIELGELDEDEPAKEFVLQLMNEHLEQLRARAEYAWGFLDIDKVVEEELGEYWVMHVFATDRLEECLRCLQGGVYWNVTDHKPDFNKTIEYYETFLKRGRIPSADLEKMSINRDPELADLRGRLVHFKITANPVKDIVGNMEWEKPKNGT